MTNATHSSSAVTLLDVTREVCPMTFVRTRLALDRLAPGGLLLVRVLGAEPRQSVPAHARLLGHDVVGTTDVDGGVTEILLRKAPASI